MTDRLPHVREPSSGEPDVCVHCHEEWVDLLTLYETDECSVRLRAEAERLRGEVERERAAVVAWLRECALDPETTGAEMRLSQNYALAIERGVHRREGGE